jgi:hypothetical protein
VRDEVLGKGTEFVAGLDNALNDVSISMLLVHSMDCSVLPMCRSICRSNGAACPGIAADG